MRIVGLIGLLLALAIVGLLAKKQLGRVAAPALPAGAMAPASLPAGDVRGQGQQIQEQVRQSLDKAMQQRQVVPDDD